MAFDGARKEAGAPTATEYADWRAAASPYHPRCFDRHPYPRYALPGISWRWPPRPARSDHCAPPQPQGDDPADSAQRALSRSGESLSLFACVLSTETMDLRLIRSPLAAQMLKSNLSKLFQCVVRFPRGNQARLIDVKRSLLRARRAALSCRLFPPHSTNSSGLSVHLITRAPMCEGICAV